MRYMGKFAAALLGFSILTSCAFDKSNTDPNRQRDLNNREKLLRAYQSIQGIYEGEFDTPSRLEHVRLTLSYTEVVVGKTEDGEIRYQPELRAKFTRLSRDILDTFMAASYIEERADGNLTLTSNVGGEEFYIRGTISGETFSAPVLSRGQSLGRMSVRLITRDVVAPIDGSDNEVYDRIKTSLQPYIGEYRAKVRPLREGNAAFEVDLLIRMEDTTVNGILIPRLASYSRPTDGFTTIVRHAITVDSSRSPVRLTFNPPSDAKGKSNWTLTAAFENGAFEGTAVYPVYPAELKAKRIPGSERKDSVGGDNGGLSPDPAPKPSPTPRKGRK